MKFVPIPDPRKGTVTKESLADLRQLGVIPASIGAFASLVHFGEAGGIGIPSEGSTAKHWRDNATIWQRERDKFPYIMIERNADGSFARLPLNFSHSSFEIFSPGTANFYRQYAKHFGFIPKLVTRTFERYEAGRINFAAAGTAEDYPLGTFFDDPTASGGKRASFPSHVALRFHPQTGQPEAFVWEEYVREYPMDWTPVTPPEPGSGGKLSDEELVSAATGILSMKLGIRDKAVALRELIAR